MPRGHCLLRFSLDRVKAKCYSYPEKTSIASKHSGN
jgi:hypothetical protein